jgi:Conjugative transposon protein TcpC
MGLPRKQKKAAAPAAGPAGAQGSGWTAGRGFGQRAVTGALVAACICGPVGLLVAVTNGQPRPAAAQVQAAEGVTARQQSAGEYGAAFVAAWLSATREEPGNLTDYIDSSAVGQLSPDPWVYRDLSVVSVEPREDSTMVSVLAAVNIEEFDMESESGAMIWPRRYFAVTVNVTDTGMAVVGLPAPIAAPARETTPVKLAYKEQVSPTSTARATVEAFLGAYLAGSGDIDRYLTPGVEISAIAPAPYMNLTVLDVSSDVEASDTPRPGAVLHVLAVLEVASASGQQLTTTYTLTLTARDGRWETTSVDLTPLESAAAGSAVPTPTPSR